ncbi:MAG: 30S ribosomal protein S3 [Spiroplasma sp.]|nr:30S ribosomal protein S3 [Mycoplasmatales bacterium]
MGQKVNPNGFRVGIIRDWESTWFTEKDYAKFVIQDENIRVYLHKELKESFVSKIKIERSGENLIVRVITARPGIVLGQGGENIPKLEKAILKLSDAETKVKIEVIEVENADLDAQVVAEMIARQLENRANFRITQKKAIRQVMQAGAKGIKTQVSGRLGGVEMARSEGYTEGTVPLHTIRADIDYALAEALTTYGLLGVKIWIYKGEILPTKENN